MPRARFWNDSDPKRHVDTHNKPQSINFTHGVLVGDKSTDFSTPIWVPFTDGFTYVSGILVVTTTVSTSPTDYWTLEIYQLISGRKRVLDTLTTDRRVLTALEGNKITSADQEIDLDADSPIFIGGTKTSSPTALAGLLVELVLTLR